MIFSVHGHLYLPKLCFFAVNIYISSSLNYPRVNTRVIECFTINV